MQSVVIDVREPAEYAGGHAKGAINIPLDELINGSAEVKKLPKDKQLIVYCQSGNRAGIARDALMSMGYPQVINGINQEKVDAQLLR